MDQVERLGTSRDADRRREETGAEGAPDAVDAYRPVVADERREMDPGVGGRPEEGQVDPVDGGAREDQTEP